MGTLVELKSLSKSFAGKLLVDNVSFKLNKGEITTLIGQNGTGKTTLAKIILGLEVYNKGELIIRDKLKIGPRAGNHANRVKKIWQNSW